MKALRLIRGEFGKDAFGAAWDEFDLTEGSLDPLCDEEDLFPSWLLYDWEPWDEDRHSRRPLEVRLTPAAGAIAERGGSLSPEERNYLLKVAMAPTSFHEVIASQPGRTTTLRDIFLGTEVTVFERLGSSNVRPGDILYGRVVDFDDVALIIGSGQYLIPSSGTSIVLDAKAGLRRRPGKLTAEKLCREEPILRSVYLDLREQIVHPQPPVLSNTDGDLMELHTLSYRIDDAEAAFAALSPLAVGIARDELLLDAKRDRGGKLRQVTIPWMRAANATNAVLPNMTLAVFEINGTDLTVNVNSSERAATARAELVRRLGDRAAFLRDEVESIDEIAEDRAARRRDEELEAAPEVQALIAKMNADHYATWPDVPLPALKGKTPLAAMRTADGRERVEALIADFERTQNDGRSTMPRYDFNQLRTALGLPRRQPRGPRSIVPPSDGAP